ncbi:MAG: type VI secretion system protein IglI family protein, partial [Rhabdochlamydiaceae bacterium]
MTLDVLQTSLETSQELQEEISQLAFDEIASFVESEDMDKAKKLIEEVFKKGNLDIRLITYYFYAHFLDVGVKSFKETLPFFITLLTKHEKILTPTNRKGKQIENSLNWFFSYLLTKIKYGEKLQKEGKTFPFWEKSTTQLSPPEFSEILDTVSNFTDFIETLLPQSLIKERVLHLYKKIEELRSFGMGQEISPLMTIESTSTPSMEVVEITKETPQIQSTNPSSEWASDEMMILVKKLKVFAMLIEKKNHLKAAIVSKDITHWIQNFDPTLFFPKIFANYFVLLAKHFAVLSEQSK